MNEEEERLIRATDAVIAAPARGFPGADLAQSVARLSDRCDMLYLHIDADILDRSLVPNHRTGEPNGPGKVLRKVPLVFSRSYSFSHSNHANAGPPLS